MYYSPQAKVKKKVVAKTTESIGGFMSSVRIYCSAVLIALLIFSAVITPAQKTSRTQDAARHASEAAKTFTEIMNVKDKAIPKELLDASEAIAVFPGYFLRPF